MMSEIQPLKHPQQIFLQRLLASHVYTDSAAQKLWCEIKATPDGQRYLGRDLEDTISIINRSLKPGFNMEVRSISFALDQDDKEGGAAPTIYHAIVNCEADHLNPALTKTPHELAFIRLILEHLIELCIEQDDVSDDDSTEDIDNQTISSSGKFHRRDKSLYRRGMRGCEGTMSRMDMINLRTELKGPHKDKLTISQVERIIDTLEVERWLVPAPSFGGGKTPNGRKRRKSSGNKTTELTWLQIGPRTYMELPEFLSEIGLEKGRLPQFISHG